MRCLVSAFGAILASVMASKTAEGETSASTWACDGAETGQRQQVRATDREEEEEGEIRRRSSCSRAASTHSEDLVPHINVRLDSNRTSVVDEPERFLVKTVDCKVLGQGFVSDDVWSEAFTRTTTTTIFFFFFFDPRDLHVHTELLRESHRPEEVALFCTSLETTVVL